MSGHRASPRRQWPPIILRACALATAFEERFSRPPTLRRLHYELVSDAEATAYGYVNTAQDYKRLSSLTAKGRRDGDFPDLAEGARGLFQSRWFEDADDLRGHVREIARLDRMLGQERSVVVAVEKDGTRPFLSEWFSGYGVLVTSTNGYSSQTLVDKLLSWQAADGRPMVLLYAGDHDASGEDIERDLRHRLNGRVEIRRVALLPEHVEEYGLPRSPFEKNDSRARGFLARHGGLWQTELDALDPDVLRDLYEAEFRGVWNDGAYQSVLDREDELIAQVLGP